MKVQRVTNMAPPPLLFLVISILSLVILTNAELISEFTCGHLYYRTLYLDEAKDILYVGAMDKLIKVQNLKNISTTNCQKDAMDLKASNIPNCISRGKSKNYDCRNHIRVIQPIGPDGSRLYVCGTNAHNPKDEVIYANLTHLARHEFYPGIGDGIAKCPFDPEDNSTAVWVRTGNPGDHPAIYSGTNAEFTKADAVIFRGDIFDESSGRREFTFKRTIKYDSHMLDKPDFVGSYDVGEYVYFFFRETAVEFMNCGKTIYSRIARVCKKDIGGKNILHQNWVTYLKARLNCSIPGDFPFFFDEIQDVYKAASGSSSNNEEIFHAVFTTNQNGLKGSAICSFNLKDINNVFDNGKFKEQATSTSMWLPVPTKDVPEPRPGSCVDDTRELPDTMLNFIRKHPLMDLDVPHDAHGPVFYQKDVVFTKIIVDEVFKKTSYGSIDQQFNIYYAATEDGRVFKVARWKSSENRFQSRLLDIISVTEPEPIRAMALSKKSKMLIVSTDYGIKQVPTEDNCKKQYQNCVQCVHDPYCGWNRETGECDTANPYLLQDPQGVAEGICEVSLPRKKITANFGSSIHLNCAISHVDQPISWYFYDDLNNNGRHISFSGSNNHAQSNSNKYVLTQTNGLVVIGVKEPDAGRYDCRLGRESVSSYQVTVDMQRCAAPNKTADYQKIYSEWCQEFQKYKTALKTWEENKSKCGGPPPPAPNEHENSVYHTNPLL